jgi:amino acid permease
MMVTSPRYLSALASGERTLLGFDRMSANGVPMRALALTWVVVAAIVSLGELGELFALSSIAVLMQFGTSALALIVLAFRRQRGLLPQQSWPAIPTLAVAAALVASGATVREGLVAAGAVVLGFALLRVARPRRAEPPPEA